MGIGTKDDFILFYEAHATKVRGLLFRLVGVSFLHDLTQEVFMKAWENRKQFKGESEASTWVYRIAYNCAIDHLRKNKKRSDELFEEIAVSESLEKDHSDRQLADLALRSLDLDHRSVAILFYLQDLSVKEISEVVGIPEGTVKSRLNQARLKMSEYLEEKGVSA